MSELDEVACSFIRHFYVHPLYVISYRYIWRSKERPSENLSTLCFLTNITSYVFAVSTPYQTTVPCLRSKIVERNVPLINSTTTLAQTTILIYLSPKQRWENSILLCTADDNFPDSFFLPNSNRVSNFLESYQSGLGKYQRYGSRPIDELELYFVESPLYMEKRYLCELGVPNILLDALNYQKTNAAF